MTTEDEDMALNPATCEYLRALARKLEATPYIGRGQMVGEASDFLGMSSQTIYRNLKAVAG